MKNQRLEIKGIVVLDFINKIDSLDLKNETRKVGFTTKAGTFLLQPLSLITDYHMNHHPHLNIFFSERMFNGQGAFCHFFTICDKLGC